MRQICLILALFCCTAAALKVITPPVYVDQTSTNVEEWAEQSCKNVKGTKYQLSRVSSVTKLVGFFEALHINHKLFKCRNKFLPALKQLAELFQSARDDVCGEKKLKLIEQYHHNYISKVSKYRERVNKAPKMAKLLFMRYVTEISSVCEQKILRVLENNKEVFNFNGDRTKVEELRQFTDNLGMTDLSKGYRKIYLFWNMIDSLDLGSHDRFSKFFNDAQDGVRVYLQMKKANTVVGLQAICRYALKPIYSKSLLPLLRLVDLGYYPRGDELISALSIENSNARSLFFSTQICETLEQIAVYPNDQLDEDEFVALTKEEAASMTPLNVDQDLDKISQQTFSIEPSSFDVDDLTLNSYATRDIKTNVAIKAKIINLLLRKLVKLTKSKLKSLFKSFKLLRKGKNQKVELFVKEPLANIDVEHLLMIDEMEEDQEQEGEVVLTRRKRSLNLDFKRLLLLPIYLVYWIILAALKIAIFFVPTVFFAMLTLEPGPKTEKLLKAWSFDPFGKWMRKYEIY